MAYGIIDADIQPGQITFAVEDCKKQLSVLRDRFNDLSNRLKPALKVPSMATVALNDPSTSSDSKSPMEPQSALAKELSILSQDISTLSIRVLELDRNLDI